MTQHYLEKRQEEVKLLSRSTSLKADSTGIKHCTNKANPEEVVGHVERVDFVVLWGASRCRLLEAR